MKKLIPYFIGIVVAVQAICPPLPFSIKFTNSPIQFVWTFLFFGVLSIYFVFTKGNIFLKILLPYLFLNSFFSTIPHASMTTFIWIMIGSYFYLLCLEVEDWQPVFKILSCVFMIEAILFFLRAIDKDTLLNFGKGSTLCLGSVGNPMQFKSLLILLLAFIVQDMRSLKRYLIWIYVAFIPFALYIISMPNFWAHFSYARLAVWIEAFKLFLKHPFIGWGLGTFKSIFPAIARGNFELEGVWENAHNEFVESLCDIGSIGFILFLLFAAYLMQVRIYMVNKWQPRISVKCGGLALLGSLMASYTLCLYFPMNQQHTSLLLIIFVAYREQQIRGEKWLLQVN